MSLLHSVNLLAHKLHLIDLCLDYTGYQYRGLDRDVAAALSQGHVDEAYSDVRNFQTGEAGSRIRIGSDPAIH